MSTFGEVVGVTFAVECAVLVASVKCVPLVAEPLPAEFFAAVSAPKVVATYRAIPAD